MPKVELLGAFSGVMGFNFVQKTWVKAGGKTLGQVDLAEFFDSIDFLGYTLYKEYGTQVHSHVILEAMQYGVPFITSKTPAILELLDPNKIPMVDQVTGQSVASAIKEMLQKDANEISDYLQESYRRISRPYVKKKWESLLDHFKKPS